MPQLKLGKVQMQLIDKTQVYLNSGSQMFGTSNQCGSIGAAIWLGLTYNLTIKARLLWSRF